jgi:flagellar basal body-associated protein FliL
MMGETEPEMDQKYWKTFLKKHWNIVVVFILGAVLALAGAILIFLWFVADAQSTGMVPTTLGPWTMGNIVTFILHLIFWELLLIGVPAIIGAVAGWQWWKRLPDEEKKEYHFFGSSSRTTGGGGGVSVLFFIAFCIKVFIDGNWNVAIASWTLDYVVGSMISILVWVLIIFGIPIALGIIWWMSHERKKKPSNEANQAANT